MGNDMRKKKGDMSECPPSHTLPTRQNAAVDSAQPHAMHLLLPLLGQ